MMAPDMYDFRLGSLLPFPGRNIKYLKHPVAQLVEAMRYKPEGRGFDSRWRH
jgi:hypothetical protein